MDKTHLVLLQERDSRLGPIKNRLLDGDRNKRYGKVKEEHVLDDDDLLWYT